MAVLMALVLLISNPKRFLTEIWVENPRIRPAHYAVSFLIGVWSGFIALDAASFLLLGLVVGLKYDLIRANVLKSVLILGFSGVSLIVFTEQHEVNWVVGAFLAVGSIGGAWVGSLLATRQEAKVWVFRLLVLIMSFEIVHLFHRYVVKIG
jgi:uncharacterized membrane protein YfcA